MLFDQGYQSMKAPTANNLGQKTFEQMMKAEIRAEVRKELYGNKKRVPKKRG